MRDYGLLPLTLAIFLIAAIVSGAEIRRGTLEIRIKDHREAIGDFSQLTVTIDKISISPNPGLKFWRLGWKDLSPSPTGVDLTRYIGMKSARVFYGPIEPGSFDAMHLKVKQVEGVLKNGGKSVRIKDLVGPVKLPFEVRFQSETLIVLDLVIMDMSDHPPRGYELGIKGWELYSNGRLIDKIPPG